MTGRNMDDDEEGEDGRGSEQMGGGESDTNYPVRLCTISCRLYKSTLPAQAQVTLQLTGSLSDLT
jgi:hypothetical protein